MEAAQRAFVFVEGVIDLGDVAAEAVLFEFVPAEEAGKPAAVIGARFEVDEVDAAQGGFGEARLKVIRLSGYQVIRLAGMFAQGIGQVKGIMSGRRDRNSGQEN